MTYAATYAALIDGFADSWAIVHPEWDQLTRIAWDTIDGFEPPREAWLLVIFGDVDGFNDAVGVLDTNVALFTVDIYVPLPEEPARSLRTLADEVRREIRALSLPSNVRPQDLSWRSLGITESGYAQGRVGLGLEYAVTEG